MKRAWLMGVAAAALVGRAWADPPPVPVEPAPIAIPMGVKGASPKSIPKADAAVTTPVELPPVVIGPTSTPESGRRGGAFGEIGFNILKPYWSQNIAFATVGINPTGGETGVQSDFHFDGQFVPSVRLGWQGAGGGGVRAGWWGFGNSATGGPVRDNSVASIIGSGAPLGLSALTNGSPADPETLGAYANLHVDVWDIEVIQQLEHGCWSFLFSGGFRCAEIEQEYGAAVYNAAGIAVDGVVSRHNFTGYGITLAAEVERSLGIGGLALYSTLRGSCLMGNTVQDVYAATQFGVDIVRTDAHTRSERFMPIGEIEMGMLWTRALRRGDAFAKIGVTGQVWHEAGNSSRSSTADVLGPLQGGTVDDANLGLFGLVFRVGVKF